MFTRTVFDPVKSVYHLKNSSNSDVLLHANATHPVDKPSAEI